jgi:hypothetical protein
MAVVHSHARARPCQTTQPTHCASIGIEVHSSPAMLRAGEQQLSTIQHRLQNEGPLWVSESRPYAAA